MHCSGDLKKKSERGREKEHHVTPEARAAAQESQQLAG